VETACAESTAVARAGRRAVTTGSVVSFAMNLNAFTDRGSRSPNRG
jgi:hypothetical protein